MVPLCRTVVTRAVTLRATDANRRGPAGPDAVPLAALSAAGGDSCSPVQPHWRVGLELRGDLGQRARGAKRQATHAGIGYRELSNGFAASDDLAGLQAICDRLGPATIEASPSAGWRPLPLSDRDRATGYWCELSMRRIEVSRTIGVTAPRHPRGFFEAPVADNLDLGPSA